MLWRRLAALTLPLAGAAALLRVLVEVRYPHDVLAGAVLAAVLFGFVCVALLTVSPASLSYAPAVTVGTRVFRTAGA